MPVFLMLYNGVYDLKTIGEIFLMLVIIRGFQYLNADCLNLGKLPIVV